MRRTRAEAKRAKLIVHHTYREKAFVILFHSCLYYCWNDPIVADSEFDVLMRKLEAYEKRKKLSHHRSPTQAAGSDNWYDYPIIVRAKVLQHLDKRKK